MRHGQYRYSPANDRTERRHHSNAGASAIWLFGPFLAEVAYQIRIAIGFDVARAEARLEREPLEQMFMARSSSRDGLREADEARRTMRAEIARPGVPVMLAVLHMARALTP